MGPFHNPGHAQGTPTIDHTEKNLIIKKQLANPMRKPQETFGILGEFLSEELDGDVLLWHERSRIRLGQEEIFRGEDRKDKQ